MDIIETQSVIVELMYQPGLTYYPTIVRLTESKAMRAVIITQSDGEKIRITINASGKCLDRLTEAIRDRLQETETDYVFAHEEETQHEIQTHDRQYPGDEDYAVT